MSDLTQLGAEQAAAALAAGPYASAKLGAGNSDTVFNNLQTSLLGASQDLRACSSVAVTDNVMTFVATFPAAAAAFEWKELGIFDSANNMLARKVPSPSLGTKSASVEWVVEIDFALTAG